MTKKLLGILGGMGPYAALDFAKKVLDVTPAKKDWDHIHTVIDNNVEIPSRTRAIMYNEASPTPGIIESIGRLAAFGADLVVLPCNSAHYFYPEVEGHIEIPWLNMLEAVAATVRKQGLKKTLVLGGYVTVTRKTYDKYMGTSYLGEDGNSIVYEIIEAVKLADSSLSLDLARKLKKEIADHRKMHAIDSVLLGCTELSIQETLRDIDGLDVFDSNHIYASAAVKACLG